MTILFILAITLVIVLIAGINLKDFAYSEKHPQAQCIKSQNEGFIGKEQKGDAYELSKDSCQALSK
jgi:hypothetical protein